MQTRKILSSEILVLLSQFPPLSSRVSTSFTFLCLLRLSERKIVQTNSSVSSSCFHEIFFKFISLFSFSDREEKKRQNKERSVELQWMGTESLRFYFVSMIILFSDLVTTERQVITLNGLLTHQYSQSIHFALEQINHRFFISNKPLQLSLDFRHGTIDVKFTL